MTDPFLLGLFLVAVIALVIVINKLPINAHTKLLLQLIVIGITGLWLFWRFVGYLPAYPS